MSTTTPSDKPVKVSVGFNGGQVLSARVKPAELTRLRGLLGAGGGWQELTAETGKIVFDVTKIDYVLVEDEEHRIGF